MSLPIRYRSQARPGPNWLAAQSIDISRNGVRLALEQPIKVGNRIELDVKLPETDGTIRMEGIIVWANPSSNGKDITECGVAFQNLRKLTQKEKIIYFMADKICSLAHRHATDLVATPANSLDEIKEAYELVYREYLARGYCEANPSKMHYNAHCMFPDSRVFTLRRDGRLLGTLSLIPDSPCGIPLEHLFPQEVARLRRPGRRIAEVSLLALNGEYFKKKTFSLTDFQKLTGSFRLFKVMFDYARFEARVTDIVIGMHPKHEELYRYLSFETIGPTKSYSNACGKPALPMWMDIPRNISTVSLKHGAGYYFLKDVITQDILARQFRWNTEAVRDLLLRRPPLWNMMPIAGWQYLKHCYPGLHSTKPQTPTHGSKT